jgi:hypothetical protein
MSATAITPQPLEISGSSADRETRAQTLATLFVKFVSDHVDLLVQVRQDFLNKPKSETIMGCHSWGEYCRNVLHYSESHIRSLIADKNPATLVHGNPIPTTCDLCWEEFPSKGKWGRHIREAHPDRADEILGKQAVPQVQSESGVSNTSESPSEDGGASPTDSLQSSAPPIIFCSYCSNNPLRDVQYIFKSQEELDAHLKEHHLEQERQWRARELEKERQRRETEKTSNKPQQPSSNTSGQQPTTITETFYVVRRKSDGAFYYSGQPVDSLSRATKYDSQRIQIGSNRVWVKVSATYQLTVEPLE